MYFPLYGGRSVGAELGAVTDVAEVPYEAEMLTELKDSERFNFEFFNEFGIETQQLEDGFDRRQQ